jgi:hypothetical protein
VSPAPQIRTSQMPARWLRPGDRLLRNNIILQVTRVEFTPGQPVRTMLLQVSGDGAGRCHEAASFDASELLARVVGVHAPGVTQGAPAKALL